MPPPSLDPKHQRPFKEGGLTGHELTVARLAVAAGLIDEATLAESSALKTKSPGHSLSDALVVMGALRDEDRRLIELLATRATEFRQEELRDTAQADTAAHAATDPKRAADSLGTHQDCGAPRSSTVSFPGRAFGDYELLDEIAQGGMGVVYKARQTRLNRLVALKMIRAGEFADDQQIQRFQAEAEACAKLDHPGIVSVFEVGVAHGQHFYSMVFVDGKSLQAIVNSDGPMDPRHAADLCRTCGDALHYAHGQGIIHRDIKPHNVLIDSHGKPRITDFGIAKCLHVASDLTATGQVLGTPSFMPPEQARGELAQISPLSDVYALGATLYFLLTGRPPFESSSIAATIQQVISDEPVSPRRLNPAVPRDLETICLKCLRKEPERRYASAAAFSDDLGRWAQGQSIAARPVSRLEKSWLWCRRRPAVAALILAILLLTVGGTAISWERQTAIQAEGLVQRLLTAETREIPKIIEEMAAYRHWVDPPLARKLATSAQGSAAQLHASLALLPIDPEQLELLANRLLQLEPERFATVRDLLEPYRSEFTENYWRVARATDQDANLRFHAACALATFDSSGDDWRDEDFCRFVAEHLVSVRPSELAAWQAALRPVKHHLLASLGAIYRDPLRGEQIRSFATDTLSDYAAQNPIVLFDLLADSQLNQFPDIFEKLTAHREQAVELAVAELARAALESWSEKQKDALARRQANAATALVKLGAPAAVWRMFAHSPDPRVRSYIVHWLSRLGGEPLMLWERFEQETDPTIQRALLLCLGGFDEIQLSPADRESIVPRLLEVYRAEPDAGLHGAADWLLRKWGQTPRMEAISTALQLDDHQVRQYQDQRRQWHVNTQGQTFVILEAGELLMGSPESELEHQPEEMQHRRHLGRRFAISSKEVTREQYRRFQVATGVYDLADNPALAPVVTTEDSPQTAMTWFEAAQYCNWLSEQEGIAEDQWCYLKNEDGEYGPGMHAKENHLGMSGYRLPTGPEFEFACRAGAITSRYYGMNEALLANYAWHQHNSEVTTHAVGTLKPNDFGLFDMLGNAYEWCDNLFEEYPTTALDSAVEDSPHETPVAVEARLEMRGGAFFSLPIGCRCAVRSDSSPGERANDVGFRPARTLP